MEASQHCGCYYGSAHHQETWWESWSCQGIQQLLHVSLLLISPPCSHTACCRCTQRALKHSNVLLTRWNISMMSTASLRFTFYFSVSLTKNKPQFGDSYHKRSSRKPNLVQWWCYCDITDNETKKPNPASGELASFLQKHNHVNIFYTNDLFSYFLPFYGKTTEQKKNYNCWNSTAVYME